MFIYQDGKLYTQTGDKELVGVEIYSDKVLLIEGTEAELADEHEILTPFEVNCRFGIFAGMEYKFPRPVKDDKEDNQEDKQDENKEPQDVPPVQETPTEIPPVEEKKPTGKGKGKGAK